MSPSKLLCTTSMPLPSLSPPFPSDDVSMSTSASSSNDRLLNYMSISANGRFLGGVFMGIWLQGDVSAESGDKSLEPRVWSVVAQPLLSCAAIGLLKIGSRAPRCSLVSSNLYSPYCSLSTTFLTSDYSNLTWSTPPPISLLS